MYKKVDQRWGGGGGLRARSAAKAQYIIAFIACTYFCLVGYVFGL
jgi:hypothetical protein